MRRLFYLVIILVSTACANSVDDTENTLVIETIQGKCSECLTVGAVYQFTTLALQSVAGGEDSLIGALNAAWSNDISKGELSIFLRVESIENNMVTFGLVNGARVGADGKCLLTETEVDMALPLSEAGMGPSLSTDMYVYAGSEAHPKNCNPTAAAHAIPVVNVVAQLTCSGICTPREQDTLDGVFAAALSKEGLFSTCVCLDLSPDKVSDEVCGDFGPDFVSVDGKCDGCGEKYQALDGLIPAFNGGSDLDWDSCKEAVGAEAACLTAGFKAVRILPDDVPADCP
jgi:hypothetical protein